MFDVKTPLASGEKQGVFYFLYEDSPIFV